MQMFVVLLGAFLIISTQGNVLQDKSKDARGYEIIGGRTYFIEADEEITWQTATQRCNAMGMSLVSLETEEEDMVVMERLRQLGYDSYHGLHTSGTLLENGLWMWTGSGQVFTYMNWHDGSGLEPTNGLNCVHLFQSDWRNFYCDYAYGYICEEN